MGKYLGRDDILGCTDERFKDVSTPEWGGTVRVRSLTGHQRSKLLAQSDDTSAENWIERLVAACACDENGKPIFSQDDVKQLKEKNAAALNRVFEAADELNLFSDRSIDNLAGESKPIPK